MTERNYAMLIGDHIQSFNESNKYLQTLTPLLISLGVKHIIGCFYNKDILDTLDDPQDAYAKIHNNLKTIKQNFEMLLCVYNYPNTKFDEFINSSNCYEGLFIIKSFFMYNCELSIKYLIEHYPEKCTLTDYTISELSVEKGPLPYLEQWFLQIKNNKKFAEFVVLYKMMRGMEMMKNSK